MSRRPLPGRQGGIALMVMLVVVIMGIAAMLIGSLGSTALKNERQRKTAEALAQAKDALIGYAITYGETHSGEVHGYLPCPDIDASNGEGGAKLSCGSKNVSAIGRLPWKTLGLTAPLDGNGECLWYAVSGAHKYNPKTDLMNRDTPGLLEILDANGATVAQNVVAIVFAPGAPLASQNRAPDGTAPVCGGNYAPANYLDDDGTINNALLSGTADTVSRFRPGTSPQTNDGMIYITREDIFNARNIHAKLDNLTRKAAECIADYGRRNAGGSGDKRLPWPGTLRSPTDDYLTDSNYDDEDDRMAGRLPYRVNTSDSDSNNQIVSPYYQLDGSGFNCPGVTDWPAYYPWWKNWKDHLYYALAHSFTPNSGSTSCGTCLSVNGTGNYAAVVMFSGAALSGQTRATTGDRINLVNYLEGRNYSNGSNSSGNGDYQSGSTDSFNDVLYCINPDLTVTPC